MTSAAFSSGCEEHDVYSTGGDALSDIAVIALVTRLGTVDVICNKTNYGCVIQSLI